MVLKKVIIDGKVVYEPISFEEALAYPNKDELVFSSDDEKEEFEEKLEELEDIDDDDEPVTIKVDGKKIHLGKDFSNMGKDYGEMFENIFSGAFGGKNNRKVNSLVTALPFMDKEDLHELVDKILAESEEYKDLSLVMVFPFLDKKDCDKLFMQFVIEGKDCKYSVVALAPFVSQECLSKLVDEYINGKYQDVEMSMLYPFLDKKDVKRVFNHIIQKKETN